MNRQPLPDHHFPPLSRPGVALVWLLFFMLAFGVYHPLAAAWHQEGLVADQQFLAMASPSEHSRLLNAARPHTPADPDLPTAWLPAVTMVPKAGGGLLPATARNPVYPHPRGYPPFLRPPLRAPPLA